MTAPNEANIYLPGTIVIPSALQITNITRDIVAMITAEVDSITASNTYIEGQLIQLTIPFEYGMQQANGLSVKILLIDGLNFYVAMNSVNFDPFIVPMTPTQPASFSPTGSKNLEYNNNTNYVAFQNLNNEGN